MLCVCPLCQQSRRFAATLGELTGGRVGLTCGSVGVLKGAVTIAIRYSAGRQQFGPPDSPEVSRIRCGSSYQVGVHLASSVDSTVVWPTR